MGNSNSDFIYEGSQALDDGDDTPDVVHPSILTVPDETQTKPRGRFGFKHGSSYNKRSLKSGSLQSALSTDLENPEAERVKREFEMFRMNKENEIANIQKSEKRTIGENKRLRAELQALQKQCNRLRSERDEALQLEQQALARAAAFELDRDKVQRQFKIFRETKEQEIQNLLRANRDLESKLAKVAPNLLPDDTNRFAVETVGIGDWWIQPERAPSVSSSDQLNQSLGRGHEFMSSLLQLELAQGLSRDIWGLSAECVNNTVLHMFISHTEDMREEVVCFEKEVLPGLQRLVQSEGHYLNVIKFPLVNELENIPDDKVLALRKQLVNQSSALVGFLGDTVNVFTVAEVTQGHLKSPGSKPAFFCLKNVHQSEENELTHVKTEIKRTGEAAVFDDYTDITDLMSSMSKKLTAHLQMLTDKLKKLMELGSDADKPEANEETSTNSGFTDTSEDTFGCTIWDEHCHVEHMEAYQYAAKCAHECSLEKLYECLSNHVMAPGPSPPLLVTGQPGCGKSLLLAKWIQQQQVRSSNGIILYHFVGCRKSVSADPVHMIRRLTSQLMQHAVNPPALTGDPCRLMEEFPRWLEKVSSKTPGGVTVVIDGLDKFHQPEIHLRWLLDPLPVDSRVIVSVNEDTCKPAWKAWLPLRIEPLDVRSVKELLRNDLQQNGCYLDSESESSILTHCRSPDTCNPLYVTILSGCLARITEKKLQHQLNQCLAADNTIDLYLVVLDYLREELETTDSTKGSIKKVLKLIYASRNGLGDWECLNFLPDITWTFWSVLTNALLSLNVIVYRGGLICLAHDQVQEAVALKYFPKSDGGKQLTLCRRSLVDYFIKYVDPENVTCRVADELPWLLQQLDDKEALNSCLLNICIFLRLYIRGRCNELISYWQYLAIDKNKMAELYASSTKEYESAVEKSPYLTIPKVADMYEAQGRFLRDLGMLKEACNPLQRALELREMSLDPDDPAVAQSLHQLASLHAQWNKLSAAESLYKQALDIYQNAFGPDHIMVAKELDALVVLYQKQNKHEIAEPLRKQANSIRKKNKVPKINTAADEGDEIRSYSFKKKKTVKLQDFTMGPDSPELATKLNELGVLYYVQGNHNTAETFFKKSLRIREELLAADHVDLGQSYKNLAALYNDQKELEKAEPLYEKSLEIRLKHFGADHHQVISVKKNLAAVYKKLHKWSKAAPLYEQIIEIREKSAGDKPDQSLATTLVNLAVIYCHLSRQNEALPLYQRALDIYKKVLGKFHPKSGRDFT